MRVWVGAWVQGRCATTLEECPQPIDVVDLIISPTMGLGIIDEMVDLGISDIFIQPGAESEEVLEKCLQSDIRVHQGCVLRELPQGSFSSESLGDCFPNI